MIKTVKHQSIELDWLKPNEIANPKTLVLGSFNPYETKTKAVDYYYGRPSNHFWQTIANIIGEDEEYFFDSLDGFERKKSIMQNRFCCLDVVDSIDLNSENKFILDAYIQNEIFEKYKDQKIWAGYTDYKQSHRITFIRKYNKTIGDFLILNNTIKKVIHTMGVNRINTSSTSPKESKLKDLGFYGFIKHIKSICKEKNIDFIHKSYSPSDYAVNTRKTKKEDLIKWLSENLGFSGRY